MPINPCVERSNFIYSLLINLLPIRVRICSNIEDNKKPLSEPKMKVGNLPYCRETPKTSAEKIAITVSEMQQITHIEKNDT